MVRPWPRRSRSSRRAFIHVGGDTVNPSVETASINGTDTAVQCAGSGPAVVLVTGAAGSSNTWRCVIAPDLPGHRRSASHVRLLLASA